MFQKIVELSDSSGAENEMKISSNAQNRMEISFQRQLLYWKESFIQRQL